ncbi:MAG TPA: hypothetical protein VNT79_02245 [Phycisphaerae bacterium]|nr:hypothetical protein [Phycisphaerae bacterium]
MGLNDSIATFKAQIGRDKKKAAILAVLFVVLVFVVGRLFLGKSTPQEAVAILPVAGAGAPTAAAASQSPPLTRPMPQQIAAGKTPSSSGGKSAPANPTARAMSDALIDVHDLPRKPQRDIFTTPNWNQFPSASSGSAKKSAKAGNEGEESPGFFTALRRQFSEFQQAKRVESERLAGELKDLQLQSTLTGKIRSAYISGRLVHEGDNIDGFTVLQIRDREVRMGRGEITGTLKMN